MNDRLAELKRGGGSVGTEQVALQFVENGNDVLSSEANNKGSEPTFMKDFFGVVDVVKKHILIIRQATKSIGEINQQVNLATTSDREQELSAELGPLINDTNKKAAIAKALLQKIREETEQLKAQNGAKPSELRIRENLSNTLTRKFVDVMKEYQTAQQTYKTDIKKKVKRQVQIVKPDATTEEIDQVLKAGGTGELFKSAILKGEAADPIRTAYLNVVDKYQDVLTLEASVAELHQMFLDFALLTERQGELLDQVEHQVKAASDYIDEGNTNVVQAIELHKSVRRKQCCILIFVAVVVAIIVGLSVLLTNGGMKIG